MLKDTKSMPLKILSEGGQRKQNKQNPHSARLHVEGKNSKAAFPEHGGMSAMGLYLLRG